MSRKGTSVERQITEMMECYREIDTDYKKLDAQNAARENGAKTSHEIAGSVKITQSETYTKYKGIYEQLGHFCRAEGYGNNLMNAINPESVQRFLDMKIELGRSNNTMQGICTAMNKLDDIMNANDGGNRDFSAIVQDCRDYAATNCPHLDTETRRFEDPAAVIDAITDEKCKLAAELQYQTGLRVNDVCYVRLNPDGTLEINSKAGRRVPNFQIPQNLFEKLRDFADGKDKFTLTKYDHYAYELRKACDKVGENYTGTHAFRHSYAYESYHKHRDEGMTHDQARAAVSKELFHERLDIVDKYIDR